MKSDFWQDSFEFGPIFASAIRADASISQAHGTLGCSSGKRLLRLRFRVLSLSEVQHSQLQLPVEKVTQLVQGSRSVYQKDQRGIRV